MSRRKIITNKKKMEEYEKVCWFFLIPLQKKYFELPFDEKCKYWDGWIILSFFIVIPLLVFSYFDALNGFISSWSLVGLFLSVLWVLKWRKYLNNFNENK